MIKKLMTQGFRYCFGIILVPFIRIFQKTKKYFNKKSELDNFCNRLSYLSEHENHELELLNSEVNISFIPTLHHRHPYSIDEKTL